MVIFNIHLISTKTKKMSKKLPIGLLLMLFGVAAFAQTIVSTTPENKKVVLEEFTGIKCVFCPDGHAIAQAIKDANPGNVFLVNIHAGGFANPSPGQPDFRTVEGEGIRAFFGANSFPSGMINRHTFSGSSPVIGRGEWTSRANQTLAESSYVNVAVEATIDVQTSEMIVHVEGYYTANGAVATNRLNVALLQNNTLGPQTGGNMGNEYVHQHRLVDMITGQWGLTLPTTTANTFVDETFTFTLPADYNGVPMEVADMEVVAFISQDETEIVSGAGAIPSYTGIDNANDGSLKSITAIRTQCEQNTEITPEIQIQNLGQDPITSLAISYDVNGGTPAVFNWTGNIPSLQSETVDLPAISYTSQPTNTLTVTLPGDDENSNNSGTTSFDSSPTTDNDLILTLNTDGFGGEVRWNIRNSAQLLIETGGPFGNNMTIVENITLPDPLDCYTFTIVDTAGDGGGAVHLEDINGVVIMDTDGNYGSGFPTDFGAEGDLGINDSNLDTVGIYPNPASSILNIVNAENASVEVFNIVGQSVFAKKNISADEQINVENLNTGAYFVKITDGAAIKVEKILINK